MSRIIQEAQNRQAVVKEDTITTAPAKDASALAKKIGRTTYIVRIHFSKTSKETMNDKIRCVC